MQLRLAFVLASLTACGSSTTNDPDAPGGGGADSGGGGGADSGGGDDGAPTIDSAPGTPDGPSGPCSHTASFTSTVEVMGVNTAERELNPRLSHDERSISFTRLNSSTVGNIFTATRTSRTAPFTGVAEFPQINTPADEYSAFVSDDGLYVYYDNLGSYGYTIFYRSRGSVSDAWSGFYQVANIQNNSYEPFVVPGFGMYMGSPNGGTAGSADLWLAAGSGSSFSTPVLLNAYINTTNPEELPTPSLDGLALYFVRSVAGDLDVWVATRGATGDDWGPAFPVNGVNSVGGDEAPGWISDDNCRLYYASGDTSGDLNLRMAIRTP